MAEIQKLNVKHVAIMEYLIANPQLKRKDVAAHFMVSEPWLSSVVNSDAFQRQLKEREDQVFSTVALPLRAKMESIAHKALDCVEERLPSMTDVTEIAEVAVDMLDRLGFSPKGNAAPLAPQVLVQVSVEKDRLNRARALIGRSPASAVPLLEDKANENVLEIGGVGDRLGGISYPRAVQGAQGEDSGAEEGAGL